MTQISQTEIQALLNLVEALDGFMGHAPSPRHRTWKQVRAARNYLANVRNGTIKEDNKDENRFGLAKRRDGRPVRFQD